MTCPNCGSASYSRNKHLNPTDRGGVTFRVHVCSGCGRPFMSAQLVITDEFEPVARLDAVLKQVMDESDARAQTEAGIVSGEERHTDGAEEFRRTQDDYNGVSPDD